MLIARVLIDSIDADGFLDANLEEITEALGEELEELELDEVECVLHQIQRLDPVGVGARGIAESLAIQLAALGLLGGDVSLPLSLVQNHLDLLTKKDRAGLKRILKCTDEALDLALELIRSLDPKPAVILAVANLSMSRQILLCVATKRAGLWNSIPTPYLV